MLDNYVEEVLGIYRFKAEAEVAKRQLDEDNCNVMEHDEAGAIMGEEYFVREFTIIEGERS